MQLQVADYIYLVAAAFFVIAGLFRGLSGFFAFVAALVASAALSFYFWPVMCFFEVPLPPLELYLFLG